MLKNHLVIKKEENGEVIKKIIRKTDVLEVWQLPYDINLNCKPATIVLNNGNTREEAEVVALINSYDYIERNLK